MQNELSNFNNMEIIINSQGRIRTNVPFKKFKPMLDLAQHLTGLPYNTARGLRINLAFLKKSINLS